MQRVCSSCMDCKIHTLEHTHKHIGVACAPVRLSGGPGDGDEIAIDWRRRRRRCLDPARHESLLAIYDFLASRFLKSKMHTTQIALNSKTSGGSNNTRTRTHARTHKNKHQTPSATITRRCATLACSRRSARRRADGVWWSAWRQTVSALAPVLHYMMLYVQHVHIYRSNLLAYFVILIARSLRTHV